MATAGVMRSAQQQRIPLHRLVLPLDSVYDDILSS